MYNANRRRVIFYERKWHNIQKEEGIQMNLEHRLINILKKIEEKERQVKIAKWFLPCSKCIWRDNSNEVSCGAIEEEFVPYAKKSGIKMLYIEESSRLDEALLKNLSEDMKKKLYYGDWGNASKDKET